MAIFVHDESYRCSISGGPIFEHIDKSGKDKFQLKVPEVCGMFPDS